MKNLLLFLVMLFVTSCCKENATNKSDCLEATLANFKTTADAVEIVHFTIDTVDLYLLDRGARHYDGTDYIISNNCDTACFLCGECIQPLCFGMTYETIPDKVVLWHK